MCIRDRGGGGGVERAVDEGVDEGEVVRREVLGEDEVAEEEPHAAGADERGGGRRAETRRADEQGRARQDDLVVVRSSRGEIRRRGEWVGRAGRAADVGGDLGRERLRRRRRSREKVDVMRSLVP